MQRDMKSFLKNREKSIKIEPKWLTISHLCFSQGREKLVKISVVFGRWPANGIISYPFVLFV